MHPKFDISPPSISFLSPPPTSHSPIVIMADPNAVQEAEASVAKLLLDDVTGEKVSKSELKKRQKNREREAKKKEKGTTAPPKPKKAVSAEEEEANLDAHVSFDCLVFSIG